MMSRSDSAQRAKPVKCSPRRMFFAGLCFVAILLVGVPGIRFIAYDIAQGYPKKSCYDGPARSSGPSGASLAKLITRQRKEKELVGLAAMVIVDGNVVASAAHGERKIGSGKLIEIGDRWHLGSITKSITATMIARLVESGQMQWKDTIGECFPDASIHEDWKPVSLHQLLTHTSGAPANFSSDLQKKRPALGPECTQARLEAVLDVIAEKPTYPPGTKHAYSNVGYTIAAAMAENATDASWSDLVKQEVFEPLELTGAGFGPPKSPSKTLDQPRGHHRGGLFGWKVSANDDDDNTFIIGPAGIVHMTLGDLSKYALEHLRGALGTGKLLASETYKRLHTPELDDYAYGWVVNEPSYEIPHTTYWHNGSNTMWHALVVFIPAKNMAIAVASNDGDDKAEAAAWEIVEAVANQFNAEGDAARRITLQSEAFPKKSPFAAVRWRDSQPEVRVGKAWFQLVSLDGITVGEIVAFCRRTYEDKWQKRFEEDLVEVLVRMEHEPKETVRLVVHPLGSSKTRTLEDIPMTDSNRQAIWLENFWEEKRRDEKIDRKLRVMIDRDPLKAFKQYVSEKRRQEIEDERRDEQK